LYASVVVRKLLAGIPDVVTDLVDFEIYDSVPQNDNGPLLFDADGHLAKQLTTTAPADASSHFSTRHTLQPLEAAIDVLDFELALTLCQTLTEEA
jgi:hypothetical protein